MGAVEAPAPARRRSRRRSPASMRSVAGKPVGTCTNMRPRPNRPGGLRPQARTIIVHGYAGLHGHQPASDGHLHGGSHAVKVDLSVQKRLSFSAMFMTRRRSSAASATATIVPAGKYCVVSLENTGSHRDHRDRQRRRRHRLRDDHQLGVYGRGRGLRIDRPVTLVCHPRAGGSSPPVVERPGRSRVRGGLPGTGEICAGSVASAARCGRGSGRRSRTRVSSDVGGSGVVATRNQRGSVGGRLVRHSVEPVGGRPGDSRPRPSPRRCRSWNRRRRFLAGSLDGGGLRARDRGSCQRTGGSLERVSRDLPGMGAGGQPAGVRKYAVSAGLSARSAVGPRGPRR